MIQILKSVYDKDFTYPLSTPRTRLSMKNDPIIMREKKYAHVKFVPTASFVCKISTEYTESNLSSLRQEIQTKTNTRKSVQS